MTRAIDPVRAARALAASLSLALLLTASAARAEDDAAKIAEARKEARAHYEEGLKHAERADWPSAHTEFARAQALYPAPSNLFNIGQCQRALGRYTGALDTFARFLEVATGPEHAEFRKSAEGFVAELKGRVAKIKVSVTPASATVAIDGKPAAGAVILDPGRHTVRVEQAGYTTSFVDRDLRPGEDATVRVALERLPARLSIRASVAGAEVKLDGVLVGRAPWEGDRVAGAYRVEVRAKGHVPYESVLQVAPGERGAIDAKLKAEKPSLLTRWWFWSIVGVAVTGAAVTTWAATRHVEPVDYNGGSLGWVVRR